jgi:hypothetical protein
MGYHLTYGAVLASMGTTVAIVVGVTVLVGALLYLAMRQRSDAGRTGRVHLLWLLVPIVVSVGLLVAIPSSEAGSGWQITSGRTLKVKAWPGEAQAPLGALRAQFVPSSGPWRPTYRSDGYDSASGIQTGWFTLQNGRRALVFMSGRGPRLLVLQGKGLLLVIRSPHMDALYRAVRHAKPANGRLPGGVPAPSGWWMVALIGLAFVLAQLGLSRHYAPAMPERMATHWGLDGQPDGYMPKRWGLLLPTMVSLVLAVVAVAITAGGVPMGPGLVAPLLVQVALLPVFVWVYRTNAARGPNAGGKGRA